MVIITKSPRGPVCLLWTCQNWRQAESILIKLVLQSVFLVMASHKVGDGARGQDREELSSLVDGRDVNGCFLIKKKENFIKNENSLLFVNHRIPWLAAGSWADPSSLLCHRANPAPQLLADICTGGSRIRPAQPRAPCPHGNGCGMLRSAAPAPSRARPRPWHKSP